jgi:hypothetical protein
MFVEDQRHGHGSYYTKDGARKDAIWEDGKEDEKQSRDMGRKKFVADPEMLFDNRPGEGGAEGEGAVQTFDRDTCASAFVVRMALVFLDGVGMIMDRRRMDGCGEPPGGEVLAGLGDLVEAAKAKVVKGYVDRQRRKNSESGARARFESTKEGGRWRVACATAASSFCARFESTKRSRLVAVGRWRRSSGSSSSFPRSLRSPVR